MLPLLRHRHRRIALGGAGSFLLGFGLMVIAAHTMRPGPPLPRSPSIVTPSTMASPRVLPTVAALPPERPDIPLDVPAIPVVAPAGRPSAAATSPGSPPARRRTATGGRPGTGQPMIAIIIDDVGLDRARAIEAIDLPAPITISLMSYAADAQRQADSVRAHGHELMMHVPMQPLQKRFDPGPDVLTDAVSDLELHRRIEANLDRFTGYIGINNHMGSEFTQNRAGMSEVMAALRQRGLLFIDSVTIDRTVGLAAARAAHVPSAARDVFIDNDSTPSTVDKLLTEVEAVARRKGTVIAIGHPHAGTLAALHAWIPTLAAKGLVLVPVTDVVAARQALVDQPLAKEDP